MNKAEEHRLCAVGCKTRRGTTARNVARKRRSSSGQHEARKRRRNQRKKKPGMHSHAPRGNEKAPRVTFIILGVVVIWFFLMRAIWRANLFERFLGLAQVDTGH